VIIENDIELLDINHFIFYKFLDIPELTQFNQSIIWYYDMENLNSSGQLIDHSFNQNHWNCYYWGSIVDCDTTNGYMVFDGENEYIELQNYIPYVWLEWYSIIAKVKYYIWHNDYATILGNYWWWCWNNMPPYKWMWFRLNFENKLELRDYSVRGGWYPRSLETILTGIDYTVTSIFDYSSLSSYINGIKNETVVKNTFVWENLCPFRFGSSYWSMGSPDRFKWEIDYILIFNRVLNQKEIDFLYTKLQ
jgi:hypothetical protein